MEQLVSILKDRNLTIGSIESMTGGLFASKITDVAGASKVFKGSIVSYSPLIKTDLVHVKKETIDTYGVVSKEVAYEMAKNGKEALRVDICVSITGNAGPTSEKGSAKVGEVYIGVAYLDEIKTFKKMFEGNRQQIREKSLLAMQEVVLQLLCK